MNSKTALSLPSDLMEAVDEAVQEGLAQSRNEFVENAVRLQLANLRRSALDSQFQHMADVDYQNEVNQILKEFAQADREIIEVTAPTVDDRGV